MPATRNGRPGRGPGRSSDLSPEERGQEQFRPVPNLAPHQSRHEDGNTASRPGTISMSCQRIVTLKGRGEGFGNGWRAHLA